MVSCCLFLVSEFPEVVGQLPRLGKRELICLPLFTCNYVVSVWRGFLFLTVLGTGYVILLWHSLSLPYNYFSVTFHLTCVHINLVRFGLLSGHLLGNSCSLGWPYVLFVF